MKRSNWKDFLTKDVKNKSQRNENIGTEWIFTENEKEAKGIEVRNERNKGQNEEKNDKSEIRKRNIFRVRSVEK